MEIHPKKPIRIEFTNNKVDLSNAYDHGIGDWDKLAINWGYRQFDSNSMTYLVSRKLP